MIQNKHPLIFIALWLLIAAISRVVPHFPNVTAMTAYIAALPFLRNALIGDLIWLAVLLGILRSVRLYIMHIQPTRFIN
jgi:hypothetical protein